MLPRNLGYRTKQYEITYYLALPTTKIGIRKVYINSPYTVCVHKIYRIAGHSHQTVCS